MIVVGISIRTWCIIWLRVKNNDAQWGHRERVEWNSFTFIFLLICVQIQIKGSDFLDDGASTRTEIVILLMSFKRCIKGNYGQSKSKNLTLTQWNSKQWYQISDGNLSQGSPPYCLAKNPLQPKCPTLGGETEKPGSCGLLPEVTRAQERLAQACTINSTNRQGLWWGPAPSVWAEPCPASPRHAGTRAYTQAGIRKTNKPPQTRTLFLSLSHSLFSTLTLPQKHYWDKGGMKIKHIMETWWSIEKL